MIRSYYRSWI